MNISLKLILFKGKTHSDGTHPIQLSFTLNGVPKKKGIYKCHEKDWDYKSSRVKSKTPNSAYINSYLSEKYTEYERELLKVLNGGNSNDFFGVKEVITLDYVLRRECEKFKNDIMPGAFTKMDAIRRLMANYTNSRTLNVKDIDLKWYEDLARYLKTEIKDENGKVIKKKNNGDTSQKKIKTIRRMIEKYSGAPPSDEIKKFRVPTVEAVKQKLTDEEFLRIENLDLNPDRQISAARDIFVLQVYLRGSRIGALLQAYSHQFKDGRYTAENGGGKNNVGSKIIDKAQVIIDKYHGKHERLFPFYTWSYDNKLSEFENERRRIKKKEASTQIVNKHLREIAKLAEIDKPLSTHIARHTFARMAGDKITNTTVTMDLIGHKSLAVHQKYIKDIMRNEVLDKAADDIYD